MSDGSDPRALPILPNLAGVATQDQVEQIPGNGFRASYINWSRTLQMMREHSDARGWLPYMEKTVDGSLVHRLPNGACILIGFQHLATGLQTPAVPQAIMDSRNNAIPYEKVTARDVTDTHRRGICLAAAMQLGLAYELWAKMPLESGYRGEGAVAAIMEAATLEELEGLVPTLEQLTEKDKKAARAAYNKREKELGGGR